MPPTNKLRADGQRTRDHLLDAAGELLETGTAAFSFPELAKAAGVATATVYRHFADIEELRKEYYDRSVIQFTDTGGGLREQYRGRELLHVTCRAWVDATVPRARAATLIRSPEGYLERFARNDTAIVELHQSLLLPVIDELVADGTIPDQNRAYAALIWITLFDERVFIDLLTAFGWTPEIVAAELEATLVQALGGSGGS